MRFRAYKKILLLLLLLSGWQVRAGNAFVLSSEIIQSWAEINRFRTITGAKLIDADAALNKGNPFQVFLTDQAAFIEILLADDPGRYRIELSLRQNREEALTSADAHSPFYLFIRAEFHLHWAVLRMKFGDYVQGALELRKANQLIKKNIEKFPNFKLNLKTLGIIQAIAGAVPPSFQWLASKAGIVGNAEQGLATLQALENWLATSGQFQFLLPEIEFYQLFIYRNLPEEKSNHLLETAALKLSAREPLIAFALASLAQKRNQPGRVVALIQAYQKSNTEIKFCYLDYILAEARLNSKVNGAEKEFQAFIACTKGEQYVKSAYRKWAWAVLLKGDTLGYKRLMRLTLTKGASEHEDDRQAMLEAENMTTPPEALIRSRVCFDGGRYRESVQSLLELHQTHPAKLEIKAELNYRLGRAYDKLGETELAVIFYKAAMVQAEYLPDYFYASAAFYMANIEKRKNASDRAAKLYKQVLQSAEHPYKKSLDAKARVALADLKKYD